jgi:hypothetical protein
MFIQAPPFVAVGSPPNPTLKDPNPAPVNPRVSQSKIYFNFPFTSSKFVPKP